MQTIKLDLSAWSIIPTLRAKQGDVGRKFKAILTDGGVAYPVPAGAAVSVWYSGASGEGNYTDIGADSAVSVSGNEITVELITQMLTNYGAGSVCIVINKADGDQIGTWNIPYMVEPLPGMGSAAAQAYFTAFSQAVQNLPYPDPTLTISGRAADAGAVGTALAGKAPAGYGLGEKPKSVSDCRTIGATGWYYTYSTTANRPLLNSSSNWLIHAMCTLGGTVVLNATDYTGVTAMCYALNGTWSEWEYVNPPMIPGVEYRTTERWNGLPVYVKAVDFRFLPNTSEKAMLAVVEAGCGLIGLGGYVEHQTDGKSIAISGQSFISSIILERETGNLIITTTEPAGGWYAYPILHYVKA